MFTKPDPIVNTIAKASRNMTTEEASALSKKTTEEELAKLATHVAERGLPTTNDESSFSEEELDTDSDTDSDYEIPKKTHHRPSKKPKFNDISEKLYDDNQKRWEKLQKCSKKYEKSENEHRFLKLDYNNEIIKSSKLNEHITAQKVFVTNLKNQLFYNRIHTYSLDIYFTITTIYFIYINISFVQNYIYNYFNSLIIDIY